MNLHFVCRGNVYRSRLAEMYAKSNCSGDIIVSSSGIESYKYYPLDSFKAEYLEPWAIETAKTAGFDITLSPIHQQTTLQMLNRSDLIVAMSDDVYKDLHILFPNISCNNISYWNIKDYEDWPESFSDEQIAVATIGQIIKCTDKLFASFK